jgi:hypothetical protein
MKVPFHLWILLERLAGWKMDCDAKPAIQVCWMVSERYLLLEEWAGDCGTKPAMLVRWLLF